MARPLSIDTLVARARDELAGKPSCKQVFIHLEHDNLRLRVSRTAVSWQHRVAGMQPTLGRFPDVSLADAKVLVAARNSGDRTAERRARKPKRPRTAREATDAFIQDCIAEEEGKEQDLKPDEESHNTQARRRAFNAFLDGSWDKPIVELDRRWLNVRYRALKGKYAASTLTNYRGWVQTLGKWLANHDHLPKNPFFDLDKIEVKADVKAVPESELDKIEEWAKWTDDHVMGAFIFCALFAGLRQAEIVALERDDMPFLDGGKRYIHVRHGKGDKAREVPIGQGIAYYLKRHLEHLPDMTPIHMPNVNDRFNQAIDKCGAVHEMELTARTQRRSIAPHRLRASFCVRLFRAGESVNVIMKMMGHSDIGTTMKYAVAPADDMEEAARKLDRRPRLRPKQLPWDVDDEDEEEKRSAAPIASRAARA